MRISPDFETVQRFADAGEYKVLPVSCEILSDICTPIEALRILKNVSTHCYLLESVAEKEKWGRYTFLGFDPKLEITCMNGEMRTGNISFKTDALSDFLRQILADYKSPRFDTLPPFTGGLVGYFSYDYLGYSEPSVKTAVPDSEAFKDVDLMLFDKVIAFDNFAQKIILIVNMPLSDPETGYNKAVMELGQLCELLKKGEKRSAVLMNAGAALYIGGKAESLQEGVKLAAELIDSGRALETLEKFIEVSNRPEE